MFKIMRAKIPILILLLILVLVSLSEQNDTKEQNETKENETKEQEEISDHTDKTTSPLTDLRMLQLIFPEYEFFSEDTYYLAVDKESGILRTFRIIDTKRSSYGKVVVIEEESNAHVAGFKPIYIAIIDEAEKEMVTELLSFPADVYEYLLSVDDTTVELYYGGCTIYQGWESCYGGKWILENNQWNMIWPEYNYQSTEYYDYWENRKAIIKENHMEILTRITLPQEDEELIPDYTWRYEKSIE
ncbi:hypothetical protein I5677_11420 [Mobilitalea sibirica]|uniref:Uncharacterized protein n=1 Tax=Mobilitalea sibirica TaxID=1462919 RepID=A0A8J7H3A4_9FIRM|nr:hypothetical protein [Mobilitalea sibirica]MBH1941503.1 hypothetical protein [Mobilitalea sibirica]